MRIANAGARQESILARRRLPGRSRKEKMFWTGLLIAMLLVIGGVERNPGPSPSKNLSEEEVNDVCFMSNKNLNTSTTHFDFVFINFNEFFLKLSVKSKGIG